MQTVDTELAAWLRLLSTPNLPRRAARHLLAAFGGVEPIFESDGATLSTVVSPAIAKAALAPWADQARLVDQLADWLATAPAGSARRLIPIGDPLYPKSCLAMGDPPLAVFAAGQISETRLQCPALAIVGSRHPTPQGLDNARAFARHLGEQGFSIVSGLALGIDAAAHEAALDTVGGTVAVIGTGIDQIYPVRHRSLYRRIEEAGLLLSEYPLGMPPLAHNFPERNRLIAGMARGTLVVEAAVQSGSLITARLALEVGSEVFAIPGSIHSPQSKGCHALIKQGAKLVESAEDILVELGSLPFGRAGAGTRSADRANGIAKVPAETESITDRSTGSPDPLLAALGWEPMSLDALSARTGRSVADLGARLLDLELDGAVRRLPGQLFQRCAQA